MQTNEMIIILCYYWSGDQQRQRISGKGEVKSKIKSKKVCVFVTGICSVISIVVNLFCYFLFFH